MLQAKGDYIFFLDADGSTSIREIDSFIRSSPRASTSTLPPGPSSIRRRKKRKFFGYGLHFPRKSSVGLACGGYNLRF